MRLDLAQWSSRLRSLRILLGGGEAFDADNARGERLMMIQDAFAIVGSREPLSTEGGITMTRVKSIRAALIGFFALTATAAPSWAAQIRTVDDCTSKIFVNSVFFCGTAPGTGTLTFTNIGIHI